MPTPSQTPAAAGTRRPARPWHPTIVDYSRMLAVGTAGFLVDFGMFNVLLVGGLPPNAANLAAICVSSGLVFGANLGWTYQHREVALPHHSVLKFATVQVISLVIVTLGVAVTTLVTSSVLLWNVAKLLLSIGLGFGRFYAYREWVYTDHGRPEPD